MATGFPDTSTLSPQVYVIEKDNSLISATTNPHKVGIVGFASKGPINIPTVINSRKELYTTFGLPHPDVSDPFLIYAAEVLLQVSDSVTMVRVANVDPSSDEQAETASVDVESAGNLVKIESNTAGSYVFSIDSFFRWRLNGILASKTLVVLADTYTVAELVTTLNDQLATEDGITFYANSSDKISVKSTFAYGTGSSIELVSVKDAMYGPSSVSGLGTLMTKAATTGSVSKYPNNSYTAAGTYDFTGLTNLNLQVVINGTNDVAIDNVVQVIDLVNLENLSNNIDDVVDEITTQIANGDIPGGFTASKVSNSLKLTTNHAGRDAKVLVKVDSTADAIFGFDNITAVGTSPSAVTGATTYTAGIVTGNDTNNDDVSLTINADSPGIEGNNLKVVVTNSADDGTFTFQVLHNGVIVETWASLTKTASATRYVGSYLADNSNYIKVDDNTAITVPPINGTYTLTGGTDGIPADPEDQDALIIGSATAMTGLQSLSDKEQTDIDLLAAPGQTSTSVNSALISIAEGRGDCLAVIDPPFGLTVTEITQWQNGTHPLNTTRFDSNSAALYWPWFKYRDTSNRVDVWLPPSCTALATIVRSDDISDGPWLAPAGATRGKAVAVTDVFSRPSLTERNDMYGDRNAVNPIIDRNGTGFAIWGQKTLQRSPTAFDRINVRRMMFYVEKRIKQANNDILFDPHDEKLRRRAISIADGILSDAKTKQGITDYFIKCDEELNTPDVINRNELRMQIGIQPTYAAEFILVEFSLHKTGSFTENTST